MKKIKKIVKFIKSLALLGATLTGILYMLYIATISVITYLHNRPIRTAVLCLAFGVIMMTLDTIEDNKRRQAQTKANRCRQAKRQFNR